MFGEEEDYYLKRVGSHLHIRDYRGAIKECQSGFESFSDSERLKQAELRVLSEAGMDREALDIWKNFQKTGTERDLFPLLETLAWGVLEKGDESSHFFVNVARAVSAAYTQDVRAVNILLSQMRSSNAFLRGMAVYFSTQYRDRILIEELKTMLKTEKVWHVKLSVIQALGSIGEKDAAEALQEIVVRSSTTYEEKGVAIQGLVNIYDTINEEEFDRLLKNKRAGLRRLACEIVTHLDLNEKAVQIAGLLDDHCPDVRISALNTLGLIDAEMSEDVTGKIIQMTQDPDPHVSITAAFLCLRVAPEKGKKVLTEWILGPKQQYQCIAASALAVSGESGKKLTKKLIKKVKDPYVRANLALGMISQQVNVQKACQILFQFLDTTQDKIMWDGRGNALFMPLMPSEVRHIAQIPQYPAMVDHLTRLELLNTLAIMQHPKAEDAIRKFLKETIHGVTFAASTMLLQEGQKEIIDILKMLLKEENHTVRMQAALVLALSGGDKEAISVLKECYPKADREMKINILGALGHLGAEEAIPFLIELLDDPFELLRLIAASALIQCVYH